MPEQLGTETDKRPDMRSFAKVEEWYDYHEALRILERIRSRL